MQRLSKGAFFGAGAALVAVLGIGALKSSDNQPPAASTGTQDLSNYGHCVTPNVRVTAAMSARCDDYKPTDPAP